MDKFLLTATKKIDTNLMPFSSASQTAPPNTNNSNAPKNQEEKK
jgi:hypothetical protein